MAKIKVTQVKSAINRPQRQKLTLQALGLGKLNRTVEHEATPQIIRRFLPWSAVSRAPKSTQLANA